MISFSRFGELKQYKVLFGFAAAVVSILMIGILMRCRCDPCGPEKEDNLIVMNLRLSLYHTSVKT